VELPGPGAVPVRPSVARVSSLMTVPRMMGLDREVAVLSVAAHKEMLADKNGFAFDRAFAAQQLAIQTALKNKLVVFEHYASPELGPILAEGRAMTEDHYSRALGLLSMLDADSNPIPARDNRIKLNALTPAEQ